MIAEDWSILISVGFLILILSISILISKWRGQWLRNAPKRKQKKAEEDMLERALEDA